MWDKFTGEPLHNAIGNVPNNHEYNFLNYFPSMNLVWNDIRTDSTVDIILAKVPENNTNHFKQNCGLPISPYFSAFKLKWLMYYVPQVKKAVKLKRCLFGTVDTWLLWVRMVQYLFKIVTWEL